MHLYENTLPSTLYIMIQNLKLLRLTVKEELHLQENTLTVFDLGVKVTPNVAQYPVHHVNLGTKFEVATSNGLGVDTFTRNVTDGSTQAQRDRWTTDRLWYEVNIPFFLKKKRV